MEADAWGYIKDWSLVLFGAGGLGTLIRTWWISRRKDREQDVDLDQQRTRMMDDRYQRLLDEQEKHCQEMLDRARIGADRHLEDEQKVAERMRRRAERFEVLLSEVREELATVTAELIKYRSQQKDKAHE